MNKDRSVKLEKMMMDQNYQGLFDETKEPEGFEDVYYHIIGMQGLKKEQDDVVKYFESMRDFAYSKDPVSTMYMHILLLATNEEYDKAYEVVDYYKNLPYESQEVVEALHELPKFLKQAILETKQAKDIKSDDIHKMLKSDDYNVLLNGLKIIKNANLNMDEFIDDIERNLISFPSQMVRSSILMLLKEKEYDKPVKFRYFDEKRTVIPKDLEIISIDKLKAKKDRLYELANKDISLANAAFDYLSMYITTMFPEQVDIDDDFTLEAIIALAESSFDRDINDMALEKEAFRIGELMSAK